VLVFIVAIWASFGGYGYWIASVKRRSPGEGLLLGILFGPVGCVVEALLGERTAEDVEQDQLRLQAEIQAKLQEEKDRRSALHAEYARHKKEAQERAEAARARRSETYTRFSIWFDRMVLKFGWYKALPEVAQPIVIGLVVAVPLVAVLFLMFKRSS
jgi:hypothetical protein